MNELAINSHEFDDAKKQLKEFSEIIPSKVDLKTITSHEGIFDWFEHKVTGNELNEITAEIQQLLISINDWITKSIKEFGKVYMALEALDKDYIQSIIIAIRAAEKASNQAKKAAEEAQKNTKDIAETIEVQKKTINVLIQFKSKIDKLEHLINIDDIWCDNQKLMEDVESTNSKMKTLEEGIDKTNLEYESKINHLAKQMKVSYILAGSSIGIALTCIMLNILGVI